PLAGAFEPLLRLVYDLRLQPARRLEPLLEEGAAFRIGEPEEMVLRALQHRGCARVRRIRVSQLRGGVHGAAVLARVAVLVLRAAAGAFALYVAVLEQDALRGAV